jgi:hypothetical protein
MILLCNLALLWERLYGALHGRMGGLKIHLRAHAGMSIYACCQDCRHQFRIATSLVYSVLAGPVGAPSLSHGSARSGPTTAATWRTQAFDAVGFAMRHGGNPSYDCAALADRPRLPSGGDTVAAALTTARVTLWEVRFHDLCRAVKGVGARYFGSRFFGLRGLHAGHCSAHSACHLIHCTRHSTGKVKPCGLTSAARIFLELSGRTLAWPALTLLKIATSKSM